MSPLVGRFPGEDVIVPLLLDISKVCIAAGTDHRRFGVRQRRNRREQYLVHHPVLFRILELVVTRGPVLPGRVLNHSLRQPVAADAGLGMAVDEHFPGGPGEVPEPAPEGRQARADDVQMHFDHGPHADFDVIPCVEGFQPG